MLRMYMGYSASGGSSEGAILIFAHTAREARNVGWQVMGDELTGGEFLDFRASRIRGCEWLRDECDKEKYANDQAHVIRDVKSCEACERWGESPIGLDNLCLECRTEDARKTGEFSDEE